ncbi:hypothetical protein BHM03_00036151 [Ensete ventricosum]|nr:hypothetical protein BHM03_00036151 [Ensete ventricosum]
MVSLFAFPSLSPMLRRSIALTKPSLSIRKPSTFRRNPTRFPIKALKEWRVYEDTHHEKDLAHALRFLRSMELEPLPAEQSSVTSVDLVTWQLRSFLRVVSLDVPRSCRRPEPSCLGSVESFRRSIQGSAPLDRKKSPGDGMGSEHLYLRRRGGRTRVTSSLQDLTGHRLPIAGGTVYWSAATPALTRRLSLVSRGYCSSIGHPDTSLVASNRGYCSLVGHCACPGTSPVAYSQGVLFVGQLL